MERKFRAGQMRIQKMARFTIFVSQVLVLNYRNLILGLQYLLMDLVRLILQTKAKADALSASLGRNQIHPKSHHLDASKQKNDHIANMPPHLFLYNRLLERYGESEQGGCNQKTSESRNVKHYSRYGRENYDAKKKERRINPVYPLPNHARIVDPLVLLYSSLEKKRNKLPQTHRETKGQNYRQLHNTHPNNRGFEEPSDDEDDDRNSDRKLTESKNQREADKHEQQSS